MFALAMLATGLTWIGLGVWGFRTGKMPTRGASVDRSKKSAIVLAVGYLLDQHRQHPVAVGARYAAR